MKNNARRLVLKGIWVTPIVTAISIPAHAQTSVCNINDIAGVWEILDDLDSIFQVILVEDGTGTGSGQNNVGDVTWNITGDNIEIIILDNDNIPFVIFTGIVVNTDCNEISGTTNFGVSFLGRKAPSGIMD